MSQRGAGAPLSERLSQGSSAAHVHDGHERAGGAAPTGAASTIDVEHLFSATCAPGTASGVCSIESLGATSWLQRRGGHFPAAVPGWAVLSLAAPVAVMHRIGTIAIEIDHVAATGLGRSEGAGSCWAFNSVRARPTWPSLSRSREAGLVIYFCALILNCVRKTTARPTTKRAVPGAASESELLMGFRGRVRLVGGPRSWPPRP